MTSMAFIMGVVPLVIATGAGAEMRQAMGIAVFAGMLGVTLFGLLLTPVFYVVVAAVGGAGCRQCGHPPARPPAEGIGHAVAIIPRSEATLSVVV